MGDIKKAREEINLKLWVLDGLLNEADEINYIHWALDLAGKIPLYQGNVPIGNNIMFPTRNSKARNKQYVSCNIFDKRIGATITSTLQLPDILEYQIVVTAQKALETRNQQ